MGLGSCPSLLISLSVAQAGKGRVRGAEAKDRVPGSITEQGHLTRLSFMMASGVQREGKREREYQCPPPLSGPSVILLFSSDSTHLLLVTALVYGLLLTEEVINLCLGCTTSGNRSPNAPFILFLYNQMLLKKEEILHTHNHDTIIYTCMFYSFLKKYTYGVTTQKLNHKIYINGCIMLEPLSYFYLCVGDFFLGGGIQPREGAPPPNPAIVD